VINVSWEDAQAYVGWLSQRTGKTYRLLSEAEWEYACRAGTTTRYAFGDSITKQQAQFSERGLGDAKRTVEVGTFAPNAWGLYDMHGNVWEWCADNWHPDYKTAPQDGSIWAGGDQSLRILRGGSWDRNNPVMLRSAGRSGGRPSDRDLNVGFRVARTL
jgi:formylglycine-generating enzyme required for sulfatase activity